MTQRTEPRIVFFDLETLPDLNAALKFWPQLSSPYENKLIKAQMNSVAIFGYQIFGEKQAKCLHAWDFKPWRKNVNNDEEFLGAIYGVLKDADCVVTQNGKRFDWPFLQTRFLKYSLPVLPEIQHVDTKKISKSKLLLVSNSLDNISEFLTGEGKMKHEGWPLWVKVHERDPQAMVTMSKYCRRDVEALAQSYKRLMPFIKDIPNYNRYRSHEEFCCSNCGSTRLKSEGIRATKQKIYRRLVCKDCGTWMQQITEDKEPRTF